MQEIKKYRIRIPMRPGTTQPLFEEEFEAEDFHNSDMGYYRFIVDGKRKYYPINQTIVEEL